MTLYVYLEQHPPQSEEVLQAHVEHLQELELLHDEHAVEVEHELQLVHWQVVVQFWQQGSEQQGIISWFKI